MKPDLFLVDLVVRDMEATLAFYRALGVEIPESAIWRTATGAHHVDFTMPGVSATAARSRPTMRSGARATRSSRIRTETRSA